ncbi:leucine-rich repeat extensin-like protein 3 isoform X2 [Durio zibethinus]|uniref:Leucine-rich repeat extensin-like protein 3 isoform X2 n=1 Tax=Durio zibethinus TaxID=66656 RepID=A0A6P6A797_DURZI|nr:leucine-rich repeat extensin-like protein 3 isoform X2 [Durio zibethinus]XP_022760621.1 leucine-rich repeat extensin-like protein 3 isoform X2 [Durio zibethinus]
MSEWTAMAVYRRSRRRYMAFTKLTIIGWADPERIVKAIRKTRKIATICSHSEPTEAAAQPTEQPPEGGSARPEAANPPPSEAPPAEAEPQPQSQPEVAPPAEPPKDQPPPEKPQSKPAPTPAATDANANQQPSQPSGPKDVGEVHEICHHPPDHGQRYGYVHSYGGPWSRRYPNSQGNFYPEPLSRHPNSQIFHHEPPQPAFATHSYNTYKPPPYVTEYEYVHSPPRFTHYSRIDHYNEDYHNNYSSGSSSNFYPEPLSRHPNSQVFHHEPPQPAFVTHSYNTYKRSPYVTEYEYVHSPPRYMHYSRIDHYNEDYHNNYSSGSSSSSSSNGNITSIFSDENPNACRIM